MTHATHERVEAHPAVEAWAAIGDRRRITRVELLKEKRKTVAYRLHVDGGSSIVAKLQPVEIVRRERAVYTDLLPHIGLSVPDYLGSVETGTATRGWTFLADAGDEEFTATQPEHRLLAAEWLARLHSESAEPDRHRLLLGRSTAGDYLERLVDARIRIAEWSVAATDPGARERLGEAVGSLARAESYWPELAREWAAAPVAIVHGDFAPRNIRIGGSGDRRQLLAFDWDMAAISVTALDLWWMASFPDAIESYSRRVRSVWPAMDEHATRRCAVFGTALQAVDWLDWAAWDPMQWAFVCGWVEELALAVDALGSSGGLSR